jgi:hypothetical protein
MRRKKKKKLNKKNMKRSQVKVQLIRARRLMIGNGT